MDADLAVVLASLIHGRSVAALATLHDGGPFASMIPYATLVTGAPPRLRFVTHVSGLSAHTRDMRADPRVCLLVMAAESGAVPPQAMPRVSLPCTVEFVPPGEITDALMAVSPLFTVIPDVGGRGAPPDLAGTVRNALGIEA